MSNYTCGHCDDGFPNYASLLDHVRNEHDELVPADE